MESMRQAQERNNRYHDRASKELCKLQANDSQNTSRGSVDTENSGQVGKCTKIVYSERY